MKPYQHSCVPLPDGMRVKAPTVDLRGHKYGRLSPMEVVGRSNGSLSWLCKCDCGNTVVRTSSSLRKKAGVTSSCGCFLTETNREHIAKIRGWNKGKTYANKPEGSTYATKGSWAEAVRRVKGKACEVCGWDKAPCDVHHRVPKADGGKNTVDNGVVLCPNCHRLAHESGGPTK
jgi:hypothetical protein